MIVNEREMVGNVSVILPCDLIPAVTSDLPMSLSELCNVSDAMDTLITIRNEEMSTIENMEVWE